MELAAKPISKPRIMEKAAKLLAKWHLFKPEPTREEKLSSLFDAALQKAAKMDSKAQLEKLNEILRMDPGNCQALA